MADRYYKNPSFLDELLEINPNGNPVANAFRYIGSGVSLIPIPLAGVAGELIHDAADLGESFVMDNSDFTSQKLPAGARYALAMIPEGLGKVVGNAGKAYKVVKNIPTRNVARAVDAAAAAAPKYRPKFGETAYNVNFDIGNAPTKVVGKDGETLAQARKMYADAMDAQRASGMTGTRSYRAASSSLESNRADESITRKQGQTYKTKDQRTATVGNETHGGKTTSESVGKTEGKQAGSNASNVESSNTRSNLGENENTGVTTVTDGEGNPMTTTNSNKSGVNMNESESKSNTKQSGKYEGTNVQNHENLNESVNSGGSQSASISNTEGAEKGWQRGKDVKTGSGSHKSTNTSTGSNRSVRTESEDVARWNEFAENNPKAAWKAAILEETADEGLKTGIGKVIMSAGHGVDPYVQNQYLKKEGMLNGSDISLTDDAGNVKPFDALPAMQPTTAPKYLISGRSTDDPENKYYSALLRDLKEHNGRNWDNIDKQIRFMDSDSLDDERKNVIKGVVKSIQLDSMFNDPKFQRDGMFEEDYKRLGRMIYKELKNKRKNNDSNP